MPIDGRFTIDMFDYRRAIDVSWRSILETLKLGNGDC